MASIFILNFTGMKTPQRNSLRDSSSKERQIASYPHPKYYALAIGYAGMNNISKSEVGKESLKKFFDDMPPDRRDVILKFYQQMKPEEKKYPHKINPHW